MDNNKGKGDDVMKQAQHIWSMLDELADSDPETYKKFIEKNIAEGREREAPAQPYMCIKTRILNVTQCDLFINICSWSRVPRPKTDHDPIPVIAGEMKQLKEEKKKFKVVPIAFNTEVLRECFDAEDTTLMLLNLALDFITDQFKLNLDRNFTKLKGSKFKGDPVTLVASFQKKQSTDTGARPEVQDDDDSLIGRLGNIIKRENTQLDQTKETDGVTLNTNPTKKPTQEGRKLIEEINSTEISLPEPEYFLEVVNNDDKRGRHIDIRISLPSIKSVQQCELDISEDDVRLLVEDLYKLQLNLPEAVLEDDTTAKFNKKSATLNIKIPIKSQGKR